MVKNLQFEDGKMIAAAQYFSSGSSAAVELTEEEKTFAEQMRVGPPLLLIVWEVKKKMKKEVANKLYLTVRKCSMLTIDNVFLAGSVAEYSQ